MVIFILPLKLRDNNLIYISFNVIKCLPLRKAKIFVTITMKSFINLYYWNLPELGFPAHSLVPTRNEYKTRSTWGSIDFLVAVSWMDVQLLCGCFGFGSSILYFTTKFQIVNTNWRGYWTQTHKHEWFFSIELFLGKNTPLRRTEACEAERFMKNVIRSWLWLSRYPLFIPSNPFCGGRHVTFLFLWTISWNCRELHLKLSIRSSLYQEVLNFSRRRQSSIYIFFQFRWNWTIRL